MVLSSLSVVVSSLALNAYRRPNIDRLYAYHRFRLRASSEAARRRLSHLRPFLLHNHRGSSASASASASMSLGDVELAGATIAQGRRHQRSQSQPPAAPSHHRRRPGSLDSLGSLASSLGSAASDDGGLGAFGALAALDVGLDASAGGGTTALSRLWQRMRGYRNLPPESGGNGAAAATEWSGGRAPAATVDVGGLRGEGLGVSSHRETV